MPRRTTPLVIEEYYHLFNRTVDKLPIFDQIKNCNRALNTLKYYTHINSFPRFSKLFFLPNEERFKIINDMNKEKRLVDVIAFCLMPNHFHLLLRQLTENGISKLLANFQNSFARYFNTKFDRAGPLWQGQFKAVRIEDDEQLLHVSRYIHLNPFTSNVVKDLKELESYQWSSLPEYTTNIKNGFCQKEIILSNYRSFRKYREFVLGYATYQRDLHKIKHLLLEQ